MAAVRAAQPIKGGRVCLHLPSTKVPNCTTTQKQCADEKSVLSFERGGLTIPFVHGVVDTSSVWDREAPELEIIRQRDHQPPMLNMESCSMD